MRIVLKPYVKGIGVLTVKPAQTVTWPLESWPSHTDFVHCSEAYRLGMGEY